MPSSLTDQHPVVVVGGGISDGWGVAGAIAALIGAGLGMVNQALAVIPMIVVAIFFIWLLVKGRRAL